MVRQPPQLVFSTSLLFSKKLFSPREAGACTSRPYSRFTGRQGTSVLSGRSLGRGRGVNDALLYKNQQHDMGPTHHCPTQVSTARLSGKLCQFIPTSACSLTRAGIIAVHALVEAGRRAVTPSLLGGVLNVPSRYFDKLSSSVLTSIRKGLISWFEKANLAIWGSVFRR